MQSEQNILCSLAATSGSADIQILDMKTKFTKSSRVIAALTALPFVSQAQQTAPDDLISSSGISWMVILISTGAIYGNIKMHSRKQTIK